MRYQSNTTLQLILFSLISFCTFAAPEKEYLRGNVSKNLKEEFTFKVVRDHGPYQFIVIKGKRSCSMRILGLTAPRQTRGEAGTIKIIPSKCWVEFYPKSKSYELVLNYRLHADGWRGLLKILSKKKKEIYDVTLELPVTVK